MALYLGPLLNEVPEPVLFNTWKHHAGVLRERIRCAANAGETGLIELAQHLCVVGTELMDLYLGELTPVEIARSLLAALEVDQHRPLAAYRRWLQLHDGYQVITLPGDASRWVLRLGDEHGRYVHIHPARWATWTHRVKANVLKTAVLSLAAAGMNGGQLTVAAINDVRQAYLQLSPIGALCEGQGLHELLRLLGGAV